MRSPIEIDAELCKSCSFCIDACPQKCIRLSTRANSKGYRYAEPFEGDEACTNCGNCALMCPEAAVTIYAPEEAA